jgi:hypothetical protein
MYFSFPTTFDGEDLSFVQQNAVLHKSCSNKMSFKVLAVTNASLL